MPVNTSSTGATYGKSTDPLCPLGFHPQVRWPTRCKRCFRDYKEHSDSGDQKKFSGLKTKDTTEDPWTVRKSSFQKSRSVDVNIEAGASSGVARFAEYTTAAATEKGSKAEEDIPEWKKAMLERRKKDKEREDQEEARSRNFGFVPGTTLHSSYVNKSHETDARLNTWGSASNLRSSSYTNLNEATEEDSYSRYSRGNRETSTESNKSSVSRWTSGATTEKKTEAELTPYEKYLQRKKEQDKKEEEDTRKKDEDRREEERKKERDKKREEERKREQEQERERERLKKREADREATRLEEEKKRKEEEEKNKKEAEVKKTNKWGTTSSKQTWGSTKEAPKEEMPKKKPWEKPSSAAKSSLPSLNESAPKKKLSFEEPKAPARKTSESDSDSISMSSKPASFNLSDNDHELKTMKTELECVKNDLKAVKSRNDVLERIQGDASNKTSMTLDSAKASEATAELMKAREKIREQDTQLTGLSKDKKAMNLKMKELESTLEKRPQLSETQKTITELQTKNKFLERKNEDLQVENTELNSNCQNLESELEEVQDNFREDEADEYRSLKRELENSAKNCRVLQFKLKKTEKSMSDLQSDHNEIEGKLKTISGGSNALDSMNKIRNLEKELDDKKHQISKLEGELKSIPKVGQSGPRKGGLGPVMSRTGSVERNVEDQLLKDLQDSIERENDLKEQLSMAEGDAVEHRKKLSRLEDENESLSGTVKKMAAKKPGARRSPSPYNKGKEEPVIEDGEEVSAAEMKVQLEVSEQETTLLRKKVENLLTENLKITKEVKDITTKLNDEKKNKTPARTYGAASSTNNDKKLEELQTEVNAFRVKLIEKDREVERLDSQLKASKPSNGKSLKRTGSQDEDILKKLNVIEKEAEVLRNKTQELEAENESLKSSSKAPMSSASKLTAEKCALEERLRGLESKLKDSTRKITELEETGKGSMKINLEIDRLKRDKISLETELTKTKDTASTEKRKAEKLERDLAAATDKSEKSQREIIAAEREKRRTEDDKNKLDNQISKIETELRSVTREKDRYKDESDQARQKNKENLSQTQEGIKAFKDQIDSLKQELNDLKKTNRDMKRQSDENDRVSNAEIKSIKRDIDQKSDEVGEQASKIKELEDKIIDIEDKWSKSKRINQQRKDKIDKLEAEVEKSNQSYSSYGTANQSLKEAQTKIEELEKKLSNQSGSSATELRKEVDALKKEKSDLVKKHENLEEEYVVVKAKLSNDDGSSRDDYNTINSELIAMRKTYNDKSDEWIKQKLDLERQVTELEGAIKKSAGSGWDVERNRFKSILEDRDSQITNLKIESDVIRSQYSSCKKENDDIKQKLQDYEKMNRYGKSASDSSPSSDSKELDELKKQLSNEQKERKSDINNTKMKYDSKIAIMTEEIHTLKSQSSKYRRERETYKEMFEGLQKKLTDSKGGKAVAGDTASELNEAREKMSNMTYQIHVLEDDLSEAKMESAKSHAQMTATKSNYEIQISDLNSKMNEMEEESLIESGRARIAGTRTKMELAWQKERESQKKLINELNTMCRDLKSTLLEVEKEKERDRLDSKRKIEAMKGAFDEEQDDTKKQITDLQYDLLELRDAHAKLRTTNEKLRRDKDKSVDDLRFSSKTRSEYGEEKKIQRLIADMDEFLNAVPKFLGNEILVKEERNGKPSYSVKDDEKSLAKMEFKTALFRVKETKEELALLHTITEEEVTKRGGMKRGESIESNVDETPRGRSGIRNASSSASSQKRALSRKAVSMGDGMTENQNLWQSKESVGSNESLASNASIPLPIPVRTRSGRGGSESGYSSDTYNAMTIKRLERDTSVDRLSTGSRESMQSTQSEWLPGEKKKSKGLLGKLKNITNKSKDRGISEEREFGSGSDISSVSVASKQSTASKMSTASKLIQRARSASRDRLAGKAPEKEKGPFGPPANANAAFDKYFDKAGPGGAKPGASVSSSSTSTTSTVSKPTTTPTATSTLPRTYRRF